MNHSFQPARRHVLAAAGALMLSTFSGAALAQDSYPSKPITIIVPYAPGGQGDVFARLIGERLGTALKQPVIVDNRPGASGALGTRIAARAKGDGYTLLLGQTGEMAVNQFVVKELGYDPLKDFKPVVLVGDAPLVMAVPANSKYKTLQDLVKAAQVKPEAVAYASSGTATPGHLAAAALALGVKSSMVHVPYKGAGQAMTDLLGGQVDFFFSSASAVMGYVTSNRLRALAVSTPKRMPTLPNVPTVAESGVPDFSFSLWGGVFAPAETPDAIVTRLNAEINKILAEPAIRGRLESDGSAVRQNTPAEFADFVKRDAAKYQGLVKATGIQAD
ncbi:Bug family tripartite tricarboxylate transporter substrate binding protein [Pigmentiphaga litoralis]|uniref:Tripartite-type tricarboxylate transporter receptor subunit TctC n=1 Tax=Pigmentiphaga litoralis TaxID=516702 RepID=A0A7Y9LQ92_9BURK|nr:tripartite tricarboxylate transporter substrate binding protein [Pigmentiphaga litoralis]NYE26201.1 tripartite-type tricarboxylate transporter receptor subunit TctC [Pigmentiphaga litoralis]NYE85321.1 tripartite-type tricarboxylate transporter receptor subunit TctC [Pigmentiphaga litoralis]